MENLKLYNGEYKFMNVIWDCEPIGSTELVRICEERIGWKKSTTYTMLRKLAKRGLLENKDTVVHTLIKREQVRQTETELLLNKMFDGCAPLFIASFLQSRTLSKSEADDIRRVIDKAAGADGTSK
jgi:predicted transcriptional regulator